MGRAKMVLLVLLIVAVAGISALGGAMLSAQRTVASEPTSGPGIVVPPGEDPAGATDESALIGPAENHTLHVMTYNLRVPIDESPNSWEERRERIKQILNVERPTILGAQETWFEQVRDVAVDLGGEYAWVGLGRDGGSRGDFMAIYYDTGRLAVQEFDHVWLSDTPSTIGSRSWGNDDTRMLTWARFADLYTGQEFYLLNTHFDHRAAEARQYSAELIRALITDFEPTIPVIVLGDFNAPANDSVVWDILTGDRVLVDTWEHAETRLTAPYKTFTGFRPLIVGGNRIDWILTSPEVITHAAAINPSQAEDGVHPSDHLPVQALIELPVVHSPQGAGANRQ